MLMSDGIVIKTRPCAGIECERVILKVYVDPVWLVAAGTTTTGLCSVRVPL